MIQVDAISQRIRRFVVERFPLARTRDISYDEPLLGSGIVDSLGVLELIAFLEQEFQVTVQDEELVPQNFQSLECIAALVRSKRHSASARESEE